MAKNAKNASKKGSKPQENESCNDKNCPVHGSISLRGKTFTGTVVSSKMQKGATVEWARKHFVKKYERYEKRKSTIHVHNPVCINAKEGDRVKMMETRPISKTKHAVIIEKLGKDIDYEIKKEESEELPQKTKEAPKKEDDE